MAFGCRLAAVSAAALTISLLLGAPFAPRIALAAEDREPRVDDTFGEKASARHANDLVSKAVEWAGKGNFDKARKYAKDSGDPVAVKLVTWLNLRDSGYKAGYDRIMAFLSVNPSWPSASIMAQNAERALYEERRAPDTVLSHFAARKPETPQGMLALARANLAHGNRGEAQGWVAKAWRAAEADPGAEGRVTGEFGSLLTAADHKARLWTKIVLQESNAAVRVSKRLPREYQLAANAAQLLLRNHAGGVKAVNALPSAMRSEPAVQYALARYYRKAEKDIDAASVLSKMPAAARSYGAEEVWTERRLIARDLLTPKRKKHWTTAYRLAAAHGFGAGPSAVEGEFLAGWIALRFLKDPDAAIAHFSKMATIATTRTDKSRAKYWMGRTFAATGQSERATTAYTDAAKVPTVYYGALARDALGLGKTPIHIPEITPTADQRARVARDELIRAFRILGRGGRHGEMGLFLWPIAQKFKSEEELAAAASIVSDDGGPFMAVRLAKAAASYGFDIDQWGYPIRAMPSWKPMGPRVERAFVYGLVRQESEFNARAGSHAGARGLMQLMPGTAKLITKQYKVPYKPAMLTADPAYNARLGAAHLGDLVSDFRGSYILTLVAYNAGPRRSLEWIARYGDPRGKGIDPIDWVESIPFTETRHYVQKVLQNTHVYRSRLEPSSMRGMTADLLRGSSAKNIDFASIERRPSHSCASSAVNMAALIAECD